MGSVFKSIFGGGDAPAPPAPPPPPPKIESTDAAARDERARRSATGRGSTNLTGGLGVQDEQGGGSTTKKLLGY